MRPKVESRIVYTTGIGRCCPDCGKPKESCRCSKQKVASPSPPADGIIRVGRETKGRRGKGVTIVTGIPLTGQALADLVKTIKHQCGSGGTLKGTTVELQGDHRDTVTALLVNRGWKVKRTGG